MVKQQQLGILWLIDWVAWVFLISEFDCSRREKDEEERIDGEILDLVNNFIIIDYEIVARNKRKRTQGGVRFVCKERMMADWLWGKGLVGDLV
jgi:hypothetical protein